jgi:hypothetical protein
MKKSLFKLIFLGLLLHFNMFYAQDASTNQTLGGTGQIYLPTSEKNVKAIGSPYLNEKFTAATISSIPNKTVNARYNIYTDEIEIKIDEDDIQKFNKSMKNVVITFLNDDIVLTTLKYIDINKGIQIGYFMTINDTKAKVALYSKKEIRYVESKPAANGYDKDKPAEFKSKNDTYFISKKGAYARELPSKKKELIKLFPENSKEILAYIKNNKIKTSREADLITLIDYINSI